jgi:hypothetical protein
MRRLGLVPIAIIAAAVLSAAPASAQTETAVTAAGAGSFPEGVSYLGLPLRSLSVGVGVGVASTWAAGQFQVTLTGSAPLGGERNIVVDGRATAGLLSAPGTSAFSGTATVDPGDGTPALTGVPFAALVAPNADGTGRITLNLGGTSLPEVTVNEGYVTVR